ncbi:FAD-dependent oxidoreductase [Mesorhizobium sp. L2C084A000]|uniref:FAD-dependent oxidoreductase n=1 Tax=Mesorhizobium sp. L2C084A000 TaxID=1287116 RepID=UPI0003D0019B|nr:FAD-dependent oxidoreductase [Mesorhizobium sp. L2C084A000]ESZ19311.1 hypothetical protein X734_32415 [Mesorhizobium sp. L2C084A000]
MEKDLVMGHIVGGMGAITQAMAQCARYRNAVIEVNSEVQKVETVNNRVSRVVTTNGREYTAPTVVGNCHAKVLFERLVGADSRRVLPRIFAITRPRARRSR